MIKRNLFIGVTCIMVLFIHVIHLYGQSVVPKRDLNCNIFFQRGVSNIDFSFRENGTRLDALLKALTERQKSSRLLKLQIWATASPEGRVVLNEKLAFDRALALRQYVQSRMGFSDSMFEIIANGADWTGLRQLVVASDMPEKEVILSIIDGGLDKVGDGYFDKRLDKLKRLENGKVWNYLDTHFFPELRRSILINIVVDGDDHRVPEETVKPCQCVMDHPVRKDTVYVMPPAMPAQKEVTPERKKDPEQLKGFKALPYHYISMGFESPYMFGDVYSITSERFNVGLGAGLRYGYRINSRVGIEVKGMYGKMRGESTMHGAANLLGTNGKIYYWKDQEGNVVTFHDLISSDAYKSFTGFVDGDSYKGEALPMNELYVDTRVAQIGVMAVFNMNRLFVDVPSEWGQRVTLFAKPGVYATKYWSSIYEKSSGVVWKNQKYTRPITPALGLEMSLNVALTKLVAFDLFANGMWVTDKRFDGIQHERITRDDFIASAGVNLQVTF